MSIVNSIYNEQQKGLIPSVEEAQKQAIQRLRDIRYGEENKDYVWINDFTPTMIMHPFRTDLEGKSLSEYKDPNGKTLFNEMVAKCKEKGEGFVDYKWQWKDQADKIVPKISYVKSYKEWNWIVGTGIYIEDVNAEISKIENTLREYS